MTAKIQETHLTRKAILYVRQSSTHQVLHNRESQRLQYSMRERLSSLGWESIDVIDQDLGKSASGAVDRPGFRRMVAEVCLGNVGVVAARELSRFARNSRDWLQLVDVCRVVNALLVDEEAVYDPRKSNDRLLLGLKGSMGEYELDLLRQRAQQARKQKALRGELGMNAPVGYVNAGEGRIAMAADTRTQQAIRTVFEKFLELGSVRQVMMWFLDAGLLFPAVRWEHGKWQVRWKQPTYQAVLKVLKHPIYAGAYAWGKTRTESIVESGSLRRVSQVKPRDEWVVLLRDHHEGYISWDTYERIQEMIGRNAQVCARVETGAAKRGSAMLAGLLRCRRCGKKLMVRYAGGGGATVLRYVCHRGLQGSGEPRCIGFGGALVDAAVVREVMRVIQPGAIEAALIASEQAKVDNDQGMKALELALEASRYDADRARRQYDAADPENRLVTAELERRWNTALAHVTDLERHLKDERQKREALVRPSAATFQTLARDIASVWDDPKTDVRLKKRIIRTLIEEVVADIDDDASEVHIVVHWKGGVHTEIRVPRRRPGQRGCNVPKDIIEAVRVLSRVCSDAGIAAWLTRNGHRTSEQNCWTRQHVTSLRHRNDIPVYKADKQRTEGWMNLTQAAQHLDIGRVTLRDAIKQGNIPAVQPLSIGPWVLRRDDLDGDAGQRLATRIRRKREGQGRRAPDDATLDLFNES